MPRTPALPRQGLADPSPRFDVGNDRSPRDGAGEEPVPAREIAELFSALDKAARAHRLYARNNPVYQNFHSNLSAAFSRLWDLVSSLSVTVEEHALRCSDRSFRVGGGRDDLAFLFHKDGIRLLTFLPGFEDEVEPFLTLVDKARQLDANAIDDLVTLLWEQEFASFQYSYVDVLAEGLEMPQPERGSAASVDVAQLRADAECATSDAAAPAVAAGAAPITRAVQPENFSETAYFLEPRELEALRHEVELEWRRDTKAVVLDALFDRLEDGAAERRLEIVRILRQLMPVYLSGGDLASASRILVQSSAMFESDVLDEPEVAELTDLFRELSEPEVLAQLLSSLADGSIDPSEMDLQVFLSHLNAGALPLLIRAAEATEAGPLAERLRVAIEALAREHGDALIAQVGSPDRLVTLGATRLAGRLRFGKAAPVIATLLERPDAEVRRTAVEALVEIRSGAALAAVQHAIADDDRDVRIAAARGLGAVRYQPSRTRLERTIQSRRMRDADLSEQIAFFEAFGTVATAESVRLLDRLLNGRRLFGKPSTGVRACAAMALGKVRSRAARAALERAAEDAQPIVRNAVARALEGGPPPG